MLAGRIVVGTNIVPAAVGLEEDIVVVGFEENIAGTVAEVVVLKFGQLMKIAEVAGLPECFLVVPVL